MLNIDNHVILGSKGILVKLREVEKSSLVNEDGILVPLFENFTSDGGQPAQKIKEETYSYVGEVLQISERAAELLKDEKMPIQVGDWISIYAPYKHPSNFFLVEKDLPFTEFNGYLALHPNMIQSKLINYA